jgi:hypothetical protein
MAGWLMAKCAKHDPEKPIRRGTWLMEHGKNAPAFPSAITPSAISH